jgi:hypothetical protein
MLLSLAMIVRNEEVHLPRLLGDISDLFDEIVIVDTGSHDKTRDVINYHGIGSHSFTWIDDFAAARNFAFDKCHSNWIMWLDADERIEPQALVALQAIKRDILPTSNADVILLPLRDNYGTDDADSYACAVMRERIINKRYANPWHGAVFEYIPCNDKRTTTRAEAWISHRPDSNARQHRSLKYLEILKSSYEQGDRSPHCLIHMAHLLQSTEQHSEALTVLTQVLPFIEADWLRYEALLMAGESAVVTVGDLSHFANAIALDSSRAEAFVAMGEAHLRMNRPKHAAPLFRAAMGLQPPAFGTYNRSTYQWAPAFGLARCAADSLQPLVALGILTSILKASQPEPVMRLFRSLASQLSGKQDPPNSPQPS